LNRLVTEVVDPLLEELFLNENSSDDEELQDRNFYPPIAVGSLGDVRPQDQGRRRRHSSEDLAVVSSDENDQEGRRRKLSDCTDTSAREMLQPQAHSPGHYVSRNDDNPSPQAVNPRTIKRLKDAISQMESFEQE
jgi:hypothetical protein